MMNDKQIEQLINLYNSGFIIYWKDDDKLHRIFSFFIKEEVSKLDYSVTKISAAKFFDGDYIDLSTCDVDDFIISIKIDWNN
jgi:hypothetical protein